MIDRSTPTSHTAASTLTAAAILALVTVLGGCDTSTEAACAGVDEDNPCPLLTTCVPELDRCAALDTVDAARLSEAPSLAVTPDGVVYLAAWDRDAGDLLFGVYDEVEQRFRVQAVDTDARVAGEVALTTFADGRPAMAYIDRDNRRVKFAVYNEQGVWQTEVVNRDTRARDIDLALDTEGTPHVTWRDDNPPGDLRYAHRDLNRVWRQQNVDNGLDLPERIPPEEACPLRDAVGQGVGYAPHIAVQGSTPIISYYDADCGTLRLARGGGDNQWTLRVLDGGPQSPDDPGSVVRRGRYNDVAVNAFGQVVIAYHDTHAGELRAVNLAGDNELVDDGVRTVDEHPVKHIVGQQPSIAFDPQGRTLVAHLDAATRRLLLSSSDGTTWSTTALEGGPEGFDNDLAVAPDGTRYLVGVNRTDSARPRIELVRIPPPSPAN